MTLNYTKCPHMDNIVQLSLPELCKIKQGQSCSQCDALGPNLWLCLHRYCLHTGCSEQANDHSTEHFKLNNIHCVHMNLSSQRVWCYLCETEVFLNNRRSSLVSSNDSKSETSRFSDRIYERNVANNFNNFGETPESSGDEEDGNGQYMDGLVGLQNIANTCYMNAALQALSNSPPLTYYFLDCGDIIEAASEMSGNRKPGLAKSYHSLMKDMWFKSKNSSLNYVVPRGILYGIRSVYPMFRGYQQHDTQEFLRCFMDQLHEELKEVTPPPPDATCNSNYKTIDDRSIGCASSNTIEEDQISCSTPSPSQSEAEEYETCDSGVSEQSSLSDEGTLVMNNRSKPAVKPLFGSRPSSPTSTTSFLSYSMSGKMSPQHLQKQVGQNDNKMKNMSSPSKLPHRSIISDVFDGKLLSSVQCLTCNRISTREETFQDLSLPIPGKDHLAVLHQGMPSQNLQHHTTQHPQMPMSSVANNPNQGSVTCTDAVYQVGQDGWLWWVWSWFRSWFWGPAVSLHDCMAAFFSADELKGDNMYSCEQCNKLRNGIKFSRVLALPEMLCIHLKRFRHDLSYSSKISSPVNFPLTGLDMRPYLHKDCKSDISSYDLTAVICHHGTVGGGHYTSFAKHDLSGKWYEFDDQTVTEVTPEVVQNCQAYVLFYRKTNPNMKIIRSQAQKLAESNPPQASDIRFFVSRQWINRFNTFAEPGPIDNWTILCPHGGLPPCKAALIERLAIPLPQPLWDFLYKKFGGGPACNRLFECDICRRAAESLARRQDTELDAFTKYNKEFQYQEKPVTTIYAISMAWFRKWQLFARGLTNDEPGPIHNATIAATPETNCLPIRNVKPGSDYAQLNTTLWKFFHDIYGGGPEIILRGGAPDEVKTQKESEIDCMEIDIETKQSNIVSTSNKSKDDLLIEKLESENVQVNHSESQRQSKCKSSAKAITKQSKNVSFEDETEDLSDSHNEWNNIKTASKYNNDDSRALLDNNAGHLVSSGGGRRAKYELINKKEKKYRSAMKSSAGGCAMFGPEGKYQTQSSIDNNMLESVSDYNVIDNLDLVNANEYQKSEFNSSHPLIPKNINAGPNLQTLKNTTMIQNFINSQIQTESKLDLHSTNDGGDSNNGIGDSTNQDQNISNLNQLEKAQTVNNEPLQKTIVSYNNNHINNNNNDNHLNGNNNINSNKTSSILSKKFAAGSISKGHHHRKKLKSKNNRKNSCSQSSNQEVGSDSC